MSILFIFLDIISHRPYQQVLQKWRIYEPLVVCFIYQQRCLSLRNMAASMDAVNGAGSDLQGPASTGSSVEPPPIQYSMILEHLIGDKRPVKDLSPGVMGGLPVPAKTDEQKMIERGMESCAFKAVLACVGGKQRHWHASGQWSACVSLPSSFRWQAEIAAQQYNWCPSSELSCICGSGLHVHGLRHIGLERLTDRKQHSPEAIWSWHLRRWEYMIMMIMIQYFTDWLIDNSKCLLSVPSVVPVHYTHMINSISHTRGEHSLGLILSLSILLSFLVQTHFCCVLRRARPRRSFWYFHSRHRYQCWLRPKRPTENSNGTGSPQRHGPEGDVIRQELRHRRRHVLLLRVHHRISRSHSDIVCIWCNTPLECRELN